MVISLSQIILTTRNIQEASRKEKEKEKLNQQTSKKEKGKEKEERGPSIPLLLVTLKTSMKLSAMIVQGFSESDHPLFQLPHIGSYKYFTSKRFKVSIQISMV